MRLLVAILFALTLLSGGAATSQPDATHILRLYLLERSIGTETSVIRPDAVGSTMTSRVSLVERGTALTLEAALSLDARGTPTRLSSRGQSYRFVNVDVDVDVRGESEPSFPARSWAPVSNRAALIAYWERLGRPASLRLVPGDTDSRIVIEARGEDQIVVRGTTVRLRRYSVDGIVWGREAVWLDEQGQVAGLVSRIHILPLEAVREDLADALPQLQASAVRDRLQDLERLRTSIPVEASGTFSIVDARVITAPDESVIADGVVVVRDGRIVRVGPGDTTRIEGRPISVAGATVMAGLWDMHGHVSQIEWGPAYLAAGVTSVRDMGGEAAFLTVFRDAVSSGRAVGATLELAGLVDGPGERGFGTTVAATEAEGRAVVDRYLAQGFRQIKLYSLLQPPVVEAIAARAHERGVTVTGHVPSALTPEAAIRSGMDQLAHLSASLPVGLAAERKTVIDPTQAWGELLGRPSDVPVLDVEPGMARVPYALAANYRSVINPPRGGAVPGESRSAQLLRELARAGVPIVAGTDGAVPGFSLIRELELYVRAGLTPAQALQAATTAAARAMGRGGEAGRVAPGQRADLIVVDGNPLDAIGALRRLKFVVARGHMYLPSHLWRAAGFRP